MSRRVSAFELLAESDKSPANGNGISVRFPGMESGVQRVKDGVSAFDILNDVEKPATASTSFGIDFGQDKTAVRMAIKKLPKDKRDAAMRQWADTFVAKEREAGKGSVGQYVSDVTRNLVRGVPILGSVVDEANALTSSVLGGDYDEALAYQRATDRAVDADSTKIGKVPSWVPYMGGEDITIGGVQKLAGGLLGGGAAIASRIPYIATGFAPLRGTTAIPTLGNLALNSAIVGGAHGYGMGEGVQNRAIGGAAGAAAGGVLAPAANLVGRGVAGAGGAVASGVRNAYQRATGTSPVTALSKYHPGAVSRVQRAALDDGLTPGNAALQTKVLGRDGTLMDMGDNLKGQAGAIANSPGKGQTKVKRFIKARDKLSQPRLTAGANREIGPEGGTISIAGSQPQRYGTYEGVLEGAEQGIKQMADPLYKQFYNTRVEYTPRLRALVKLAKNLDDNIVDKSRKLLETAELPFNVRRNNGALFDHIRRRVDKIGQKAAADEDNYTASVASELSRKLNKEIDDILSKKGSTAYADARATTEQGFRFEGGAKDGLSLLGDKTLSAEGVRRRVGNATVAERGGLKIGVREDLRRRMMNAESAFGTASERGATKGRQILSSTEAQEKLAALYGPDPARNIAQLVDAEGVFATTSKDVVGNSATAGRLAAQKEFPNAVKTADLENELGKKTWTGILNEQGYRAINRLMSGRLDEQRLMIAEDAAKMLVARGADRDQIIQALLVVANRSGVSQAHRDRISRIIGNLTQRSLPALFSNVNSTAEPVK